MTHDSMPTPLQPDTCWWCLRPAVAHPAQGAPPEPQPPARPRAPVSEWDPWEDREAFYNDRAERMP